MEDDSWRADGSFRGIADSGSGAGKGGGGGKGKGGGPQFNRVIPKFLQKYHQGPAEPGVSTKFEPAPQPAGEEDGDGVDELDDVQKAAMEEYVKTQEEKKNRKEKAADSDGAVSDGDEKNSEPTKRGTKQRVAGVGLSVATEKKKKKDTKRKRAKEGTAVLSNKKLLSFSMDDEDP